MDLCTSNPSKSSLMTYNSRVVHLASFLLTLLLLARCLWLVGLQTSAKSNVQPISSNCRDLRLLHKLAECESSKTAEVCQVYFCFIKVMSFYLSYLQLSFFTK